MYLVQSLQLVERGSETALHLHLHLQNKRRRRRKGRLSAETDARSLVEFHVGLVWFWSLWFTVCQVDSWVCVAAQSLPVPVRGPVLVLPRDWLPRPGSPGPGSPGPGSLRLAASLPHVSCLNPPGSVHTFWTDPPGFDADPLRL